MHLYVNSIQDQLLLLHSLFYSHRLVGVVVVGLAGEGDEFVPVGVVDGQDGARLTARNGVGG